MSKNFDLLQHLEKEQQAPETEPIRFRSAGPAPNTSRRPIASEPPNPCKHPRATLTGLAHDELVKFVQRLFILPGSAAPHIAVLCGLEAQNASAWVAACASEVLAAQLQGSVCLVDANLRYPGIHEHFGVPNHHGFTDALRGSGDLQEFTRRISRNLWLLTCGSGPGDSDGLLTSERLRSRFQELRTEFDYVLVETAAAGIYTDALVLGQLADGLVLVVEAHVTRREVAQNVKDDFVRANVRMLGTVLNNRAFPIPERLYSML
jgi:succinoglycan biosynthesis transport protein ExoP